MSHSLSGVVPKESIIRAYRETIGRDPTAAELEYWFNAIARGEKRLFDVYAELRSTWEYQAGSKAFEEMTAPPKPPEASIFSNPILWIGIAVAVGYLVYVSRQKQPVMVMKRK